MGLPSSWNRARAAAVGITLLLHGLVAWWLLALRPGLPIALVEDLSFTWLPARLSPPPAPPPAIEPQASAPQIAPITAAPLPMPELAPLAVPDWSNSARDVAKGLAGGPSRHRFGEAPEGADEHPKEPSPPSIWAKPLPRVGATVTTPEGETIIWVSDYCFVSISSSSLTLKEIHDARRGVRTCIFAQFGGKKKPRDDLFDPIKRPPPPQEPGCGADGLGQSCAP